LSNYTNRDVVVPEINVCKFVICLVALEISIPEFVP